MLQVDEVVDSIIATLAKFAVVLTPPRGALTYGESAKARAVLETMFAIANRCAWLSWEFAVWRGCRARAGDARAINDATCRVMTWPQRLNAPRWLIMRS
jgi:hypothetical protein